MTMGAVVVPDSRRYRLRLYHVHRLRLAALAYVQS